MAAPNIVNVSTITGITTGRELTTSTTASMVMNPASSGKVFKVNSVVVSNIDGPKEIIDEVKEYIYTYEVDIDNYKNDINNISKALIKMWNTSPEERKNNCIKARKCLDKLRPNVIKEDWKKLLFDIL